jgi:hypothetical protein
MTLEAYAAQDHRLIQTEDDILREGGVCMVQRVPNIGTTEGPTDLPIRIIRQAPLIGWDILDATQRIDA